jgi:RNA polymerase sigma factor (TIGR02999 family)
MGSSPIGEITRLLNRAASADFSERERLAALVHTQLRQMAARMMECERHGHTLQPTILAHDAYLGLVGHTDRNWYNRAHFFAVAARAMRRMLVDYSRKRDALKRSPDHLANPDLLVVNIQNPESLLALDEALTRLAERDPRQAQVVELRYFGGLTEEEIAEVWNLSLRTVKREWSAARAWLFAELTRSPARRPGS